MEEDFEKEFQKEDSFNSFDSTPSDSQSSQSSQESSSRTSDSDFSYKPPTPPTSSFLPKPPLHSSTPSDSSLRLDKSPELAEIDRELEELLQQQHAKVKVFGVGGAGGNTISRMKEIGIKGGEFIAVNTDAQDLLYSNADHKILIGKELTMGLGAGSDPKIGEEAAHESEQDIKKKLTGCDMIFITCGLGGGTGTGAAPVIAELGKNKVH